MNILHLSNTGKNTSLLGLVVIDSNVSDYQMLVEGIRPGNQVLLLDSSFAPIVQITNVLVKYPEIEVLHLVTHGIPGQIQFAQTSLNIDNLNESASQLHQWRREKPLEILIYGCRVAAEKVGQEFLQQLQNLTESTIAASQTLTGNIALGGNWNLEVILGKVKSAVAFSSEVQAVYPQVLDAVMVKDINPGLGDSISYISAPTPLNGTLYFVATNGTNGLELWKSDGTEAGTVMLKDINPGVGSSIYQFLNDDRSAITSSSLKNVNNTLYFFGSDSNGLQLYKSDGTLEGTIPIKNLSEPGFSLIPYTFLEIDSTLYFSALRFTQGVSSGYELWKSNGTADGTIVIKNDLVARIRESTNINDTLYFTADDNISGEELWKSDGTATGTVLVKDISPGYEYSVTSPRDSTPQKLININDTLYFFASSYDSYPCRDTPLYLCKNFSYINFWPVGLWKSNGTSEGTVIVKQRFWSNYLTNLNGTLYFYSNYSSNFILGKSDGTETGTMQVMDIPLRYSSKLINVNGTLYLTADDGTHGKELWKTDGTPTGTIMVKEINPASSDAYGLISGPENLTNINGTLYFTADNGINGRELWRSDGTETGTFMIQDINPGTGSSNPFGLVAVNETLYFTADDGTHGKELWKIDTTTIAPDTTPPLASNFMPADNATGVPFARDLTVNFSEPIQKGIGSILIKKSADNSVVETIDVATAANITVNGTQLTINPTADLAENTGYYVEIANGAIKDIAGNAYAGIVGGETWNFQTIVPLDATPPKAISFIPADDDTDVEIDAGLTVTFDEAIQKGIGDIVIKQVIDDSIVETIPVEEANVTVNGAELSIIPTAILEEGTDYYIEVTNGAIQDLAGNDYAGITGNTNWNFQTAMLADTTSPLATSFGPTDNAISVAINANLVVNFDEDIEKGSGNIVIKKVSDNSVLETISVTGSNVTVSGSKLTINPTKNLPKGTKCYVQIANGAIKDLAGNNYAGVTGNSTWNFTTAPINGTAGNNILTGTASADIINGLAGADKLSGLGGNDQLNGGTGNDTLISGAGADKLIGGTGNDILTGGTGGDKFIYNTNVSAQ